MDDRVSKIIQLPAYTTIFAQVFSPNGEHLVIGDDKGNITIFKTRDLLSSGRNVEDTIDTGKDQSAFLQFHVGSQLIDASSTRWTVLALESARDYLVISASTYSKSYVFGLQWQKLEKAKIDVAWCIGQKSMTQLPVDVNSIVVDESSSTSGRLFIGGGGPPINHSTSNQDNAVKVLDLETRVEARRPMVGHEDYIHSIRYCDKTRSLVSCSEDGTARLWDPRTKSGLVNVIKPSDHGSLARPHLGNWVGAADISGEWVALGGGPRAALWHLRTISPLEPTLPPKEEDLNGNNLGGVHVLRIIDEEQRIVIGGEIGGQVFIANMSDRQTVAEVPTTGSCTTYSVAYQMEPYKIMSLAGSSSNVDLCTSNFCYKDRIIHV